jgi:hypothetical protein
VVAAVVVMVHRERSPVRAAHRSTGDHGHLHPRGHVAGSDHRVGTPLRRRWQHALQGYCVPLSSAPSSLRPRAEATASSATHAHTHTHDTGLAIGGSGNLFVNFFFEANDPTVILELDHRTGAVVTRYPATETQLATITMFSDLAYNPQTDSFYAFFTMRDVGQPIVPALSACACACVFVWLCACVLTWSGGGRPPSWGSSS